MATTKGSGSIIQLEKDKPKGKCRKWQLRVSCGKDPRTGKYRTKTRRFTGTYTQANSALREFISDIEGGRAVTRTGTTLNDVAADFLARRAASGEYTDNTMKNNRMALRAACRHLGHANVADIDAKMLQDAYAAMRAGDTASGQPASGTYIHSVHITIRLVMKDLVDQGVLNDNPCRRMRTPSRDTAPRRALKPERIRELVNELDPKSENEFGYFLAVTLGLRRGEVCGLSWEDVDFVGNAVEIRHSYDRFGNLKRTKTKASTRCLPLAKFVAEAMLQHREAQKRFLAGLPEPIEQTEATPVIVNRDGRRMSPDRFYDRWFRERESLGVDGWCLHELRHSYLSMLASEGVHPRVMQDLAGHADSRTTLEIYTHINMEQKLCAVDALENVMGIDKGGDPAPAGQAGKPLFTVIKGGPSDRTSAEVAKAQ